MKGFVKLSAKELKAVQGGARRPMPKPLYGVIMLYGIQPLYGIEPITKDEDE